MRSIPVRRPLKEGFLSLLPEASRHSLKYIIKELEHLADEARRSSEHSRQSALDAIWEEEQEFPERAKHSRRNADVDHRRSAEHLVRLALACRKLLAFAALDWRPAADTAGSGLTAPELVVLATMMGRAAPGETEE